MNILYYICVCGTIIFMYSNIHCVGIVLACGWKDDDNEYTYKSDMMRNEQMTELIANNRTIKTIVWRDNTYNDRFFIFDVFGNLHLDVSFRCINDYYIATYFSLEYRRWENITIIYDWGQYINKIRINGVKFI